MKYGSVCSGIEAASVAWESLGWQAQWYSEIEHFPSAVLAHRIGHSSPIATSLLNSVLMAQDTRLVEIVWLCL